MKLKVYRYDNSIVGKVFRFLRESDLPTLPIPIASAIGSNTSYAIRDFVTDENIFVLSKAEINRFENPLGNSWISGSQYYIRHPKKSRERYLIESENFQDFIFREQMSEIISFVRSAINVKRIYVSICSNDSVSGEVFYKFDPEDIKSINSASKQGGSEIRVEGSVNAKKKSDYELEIICPQGLKVSERRKDYAWINDFPQLMEALDAYKGSGSFTYKQVIDNSFNLKSKVVKMLGISAGKMKKHSLQIEFE